MVGIGRARFSEKVLGGMHLLYVIYSGIFPRWDFPTEGSLCGLAGDYG